MQKRGIFMPEAFKLTDLTAQAAALTEELIRTAGLRSGQLLVVGCSTSEVLGHRIGSCSSAEAGQAIFNGIFHAAGRHGILIAAQCCEHLNRAIIIEETAAIQRGLEIVNVVPQPKAGGSFASAAYHTMSHPVAVEEIKADAGMDIGDTLIGMHLKRVAVPVRLSAAVLGEARVVCARTRPKYIGGERAHYDDTLH